MTELRTALEAIAADPKSENPSTWKRPANPIVYAEYVEYVNSGRYPYLDAITTELVNKYQLSDDLTQSFYHQAIHDRNDTLVIALHTEVYIAAGQYRAAEMDKKAKELTAAGYLPITDLEPKAGMKIELHNSLNNNKVYRLIEVPQRNDWCLLAPRKRTHGVSLNGLKQQHKNYLAAAAQEQTNMNNPAVRMYRPVK